MDHDRRLDTIQELYDRGLYLQALRAAEPLGPLPTWRGPAARVLAGRLAGSVGATRLAYLIHSRGLREHPDYWPARYFGAWAQLQRRGPWGARQFLASSGEPSAEVDVASRADWLALRGHIHAMFRDFAHAHADVDRALELQPDRAWLWVEQGTVLEREDRHEEALAAFEKALALRPWYRPAVEACSYGLIHANRLDDALTLLNQACEKLESWSIFAHRSGLLSEREEHEEARQVAQRLVDFMPLLAYDKLQQQWLYARLSDAAYYCGDYAAAIEWAEKSKAPFHLAIAERLRQTTDGKQQIQLPVGYVRQHHLTCAPATLTAISQYWSRPANHIEVTEAICYDGTPAHSERKWADDQGYVTREFRVTWETSIALIDAGIPFTLTTVEPGNAHLQAVIGYDRYRGTLLVRDPSSRGTSEFRAEGMLKRYEATGPRGMLMVPPEKADALAGIELPEAEQYDECYRMELALRGHRREEAAEVLARLEARHPEHRLTAHAARSLAWYDANAVQGMAAVDRLLKLYPDDTNLQLAKVSLLRELGRRAERLEILAPCGDKRDASVLMLLEYARELSVDARENDRVRDLLRRILGVRPFEPSAVSLLADIDWSEQRHDEALELYRLAACLDDKDERFSRSFFAAARHLRRTDEAIAYLRDRANRYGRRNFWPARTLASAYEQLERPTDAQAVYEEALTQHPDDGQLMLIAARFCITNGFLERARTLLEQAQPRASRSEWLRTAAAHARAQADLQRALDYWRELLELEPLASDANEIVPDLISAVEGEEAARAHVRGVAQRFPHHETIRSVQIAWARRESPEAAEQQLRAMLAIDPSDAWARRELASVLLDEMRWDEAQMEAELALQLDPTVPASLYLLGRACECRDERGVARQWFQKSLALSVDYIQPFSGLMRIAETRQERIDALKFVAAELTRQVTYGDGMLNYRLYAEGTLSPEEILALLREAHAARPDLWQSWSGLIQQLLACGNLDDALRTADDALRRFPLLPRLWLDRADVLEALCDLDGQVECVRKSLEIAPGWNTAEHRLAELLQRQGKMEEVRVVLETALRHDPLDGASHMRLAQFLWSQDQKDEAVARLQHAVDIDPGRDQAWSLLRSWARERENPEIALEPARRLSERRPDEARSWMTLSEVWAAQEKIDETLEALDKALACNPRLDDAHSLKAYYLATQQRFDEALAACHPAVFGDSPPIMLRSREAQVLAMRGDRREAIVRMRNVVADDPDYAWAWQRLVEWYDESGAVDQYVEAAQQVVRLGPDEPVGYGYLGDALARASRRDEAKETLWRSIQMAPAYVYGARRLCDLYLEDKQSDKVAEVLTNSGPHLPPGVARAYQIHTLVAAGRPSDVPAVFQELLAEPLADADPVDLALRAVDSMLIRPAILDALQQRLDSDNTLPELAYYWGCNAAWVLPRPRLLEQLVARGAHPEQAEQALVGCCRQLSENRNVDTLLWLRNQRQLDLTSSHTVWYAMGTALFNAGQWREATKWLGTWQQRTDYVPADLYYLALSHLGLGQTSRAAAIHRGALLLAEDWTTPNHRLALSLIDAWESRWADAVRRLGELDGCDWNDFHAAVLKMVRTLLAARGQLPGEPTMGYPAAVLALDEAAKLGSGSGILAILHDRSQLRLAAQSGRPFRAAMLWLGQRWKSK